MQTNPPYTQSHAIIKHSNAARQLTNSAPIYGKITTHAVYKRLTPLTTNINGINSTKYVEASIQMAKSATLKK
jgi:hypothetical protein